MSNDENWQILTRAEAARFVALIADESLPQLFDPAYIRVQQIGVPFLKGAHLVLAENLKTAIPFTMDYIRIGNQIFYLDGGPEVFYEIAKLPAFALNLDTALAYLRYFCAYVIQQPHNVMVYQGIEFMPFTDTSHLDFQFDSKNFTEDDVKVSEKDDKTGFIVTGPFIFEGKIDPATAFIDKNGHVRVEKGVKG